MSRLTRSGQRAPLWQRLLLVAAVILFGVGLRGIVDRVGPDLKLSYDVTAPDKPPTLRDRNARACSRTLDHIRQIPDLVHGDARIDLRLCFRSASRGAESRIPVAGAGGVYRFAPAGGAAVRAYADGFDGQAVLQATPQRLLVSEIRHHRRMTGQLVAMMLFAVGGVLALLIVAIRLIDGRMVMDDHD